jgi:predicted dehydrogenase
MTPGGSGKATPFRLSPSRPLNVLVIGCGYWGWNYVRVFGELPETRVAAVCDPSLDRLDAIAVEHPDVPLIQDLEVALALPEIDCAIVATPASTHYEIGARALNAGLSTLVEKPLTTRLIDAEELLSLSDAQGLTLMVGHTFVYHTAVRKIREYLDADELGDIYYMYARRGNSGPLRPDVNALWDLASHDIAIFNCLLGAEPDWVSAVGARALRNEREDVGFVSAGYANRVIAHIQVSWVDTIKTREVGVVGRDKQVVFNDLNVPERLRVFDRGDEMVVPDHPSYGSFMIQLRNGEIVSPILEATEPLKNQCAHFIDCVLTGRTPITDGMAGASVVRVMEAIDQSIAQRGIPVSLCREAPDAESGWDAVAFTAR